MRIFYTTLLLFSISLSSFGQRDNTYLPSKRNFRIKYISYDSKDRRQYSEVWQLVGKSKLDGLIQYNIESEITTRKQNTFYQYFRMVSNDSTFFVGSERYMDPIKLDSYQKMVIKISSDSVAIPIQPTVGQILPESGCEASILRGTGSVLMSMNVLLINRKVDAIENIRTPAGNFNCFKISSDKITYGGISKNKTKIFEWYAINVGLVRMEEYHPNGKLISYKILESLAEDFLLP
ncbi:hypothetical protein GQR60_04085 [Labilibaculum sp. A4]|uniref:DUF3108 domain-containing protein n=1 Tax=Labilibaculum euxinus TaxID=2686357 RepID=A0A425YG47_9BACT|nr:hypothetical protein [Labilibaculum euxinus]MDQ1770266.1 hypothetical protein [Labilibaculum euxinus]MUP39903.1 hypothetical protein [Labilibaculum euxinus]MVB09108.1 hypothetical protein [Labilibaculum euxinus]MWN75515.1 hypothetical protein [Labilibaculum euxinus]